MYPGSIFDGLKDRVARQQDMSWIGHLMISLLLLLLLVSTVNNHHFCRAPRGAGVMRCAPCGSGHCRGQGVLLG